MSYRRLYAALSAFAAVLAVGTAGYMLIEGWRFLDALYMTVITVGTVGYREVQPLDDVGRIFTMGLIFAGFGVLLFFLGTVIDFVVEGHLKGFLEGRRMERLIERLTGHHIVAGMGRVGSVVARSLASEGADFVLVENDPDRAASARAEGWFVVEGDATEEHTLLAAGVQRARSLVTAVDTDADNVFVTLTARTLNPQLFIVARSAQDSSEDKLRRAGANRVMTPSTIGGRRMAAMALNPVVSDFLDLVTHGDEVEFRLQEFELSPGSGLVGISIRDSRVRETTGAYILAIQKPDGEINTNPSSATVLDTGDRLVVLGTSEQLGYLASVV
ncbi:MAG: potassium channel protein [Coriobacteriia bacterium]|nr:potassium channel protein [Coriobacteriia bacterium]